MKEQIEEMVEFLNNRINIERNSYFGKGSITIPLIEADKILDILKGYPKQSEGKWGFKGTAYGCTLCGYGVIAPIYNYCPNCGAKMKGE